METIKMQEKRLIKAFKETEQAKIALPFLFFSTKFYYIKDK